MNEKTKEECVFEAIRAFEEARKIEKRIKWNNDANRDSQIGKRDKALFDFMWYSVQADYRR